MTGKIIEHTDLRNLWIDPDFCILYVFLIVCLLVDRFLRKLWSRMRKPLWLLSRTIFVRLNLFFTHKTKRIFEKWLIQSWLSPSSLQVTVFEHGGMLQAKFFYVEYYLLSASSISSFIPLKSNVVVTQSR